MRRKMEKINTMKPYALYLSLIGILCLIGFFVTGEAVLAWVSGFGFGFAVLVIMLLPRR